MSLECPDWEIIGKNFSMYLETEDFAFTRTKEEICLTLNNTTLSLADFDKFFGYLKARFEITDLCEISSNVNMDFKNIGDIMYVLSKISMLLNSNLLTRITEHLRAFFMQNEENLTNQNIGIRNNTNNSSPPEICKIMHENNKLKSSIKIYQSTISNLKKQINFLKKENSDNVDLIQTSLSKKIDEFKALIDSYDKTCKENDQLRQDNIELRRNNLQILEQYAKLKTTDYEQQCKGLRKTIEEKDKMVDQITKKYEDIINQNNYLQSRIVELKHEIEQRDSNIKKLNNTIDRLKLIIEDKDDEILRLNIIITASYERVNLLRTFKKKTKHASKIYTLLEEMVDRKDRNALLYAVRERYAYVENDKQNNALLNAAFKNNFMAAMVLVELGMDPNLTGYKGRTALWYFAGHGDVQAVKYFLSSCEDPNSPDTEGCTTLNIAIKNEQLEIVKLLLDTPGIELEGKFQYRTIKQQIHDAFSDADIVRDLYKQISKSLGYDTSYKSSSSHKTTKKHRTKH